MSVLIEERDFYDLTMAYLERVHSDGARHVEIFFDPQAHMERGVSFDTVLAGIKSALDTAGREMDMSSKLIMCFLRHLPEEAGYEALECACKNKEHIYAVGLDSSEAGRPPEMFSRLFAAARKEGFVTVAHAGEEGPAAYVESALDDLQVSRVDHGNRSFEDPALVQRLARDQTPMTMCPLSNLRLKGITDLADHPIKKALNAGLLVNVNSDDPSYFGGYLNDNYKAVADAVALDENDIVKLAQNSVVGSFADDRRKQELLDRIKIQVESLS
jgi:adenosine deaminase